MRAIINTLRKGFNIPVKVALVATFVLSVGFLSILILEFSISTYFNDNIHNFLSVLLTFYILNIVWKDNSDKLSFTIEDSETRNYWSFWLSEIDKNMWKLGLYSILFENLIRNFRLLK